ncbi:MAG: Ig-like domain-containing protein [Bacteroidales bacterium]|nr:Ig-like domain-containing protein [Bacteroidales bacterium]
MKNYVLRQAALLVAAVLLTTSFWSCSKDEEPVPEPTPPVVSVTGVTLNKTSTSIQVGGTETLTATVSPKDAANKKVTWKSSNAAIASVDANGKVTGVKAGEATITVTTEDGGKTATCKVTVSDKEIKVTGVKLNKSETNLLVSGNETLTATVLPEDATNQNVTWKSDKPEIATVDANGKVMAVKVGEATITVTTEDGGKTATCKVTVSETSVAVTGVTLNKTETSIFVGGSETLTATVAPADATNQKVTWKSSDAAVASVDANGKVTGVKAGEATITVTTEDGGKTATCKVTVKAATVAVTGVTLNKATLSLIAGASETLTATVAPADATNKKVTWKSSDAAVATVDTNGKVTAVKAGEATITVTTEDGGKTATCKVTVKPNLVSEITLAALAIYVGESKAVTATVKPDDATNKALTWTSSDETVATVDATGKVTGKKIGTATITATAQDGSGVSGSCTVTVLSHVKKVTVTPANLTLGQNKSYTLKATVEVFGSGTDTGVTWTSSDTTIATVDATGKVTATDKVGTVTITATSKADPAKKGTCTVKVSGDQTDIGYGEYGPEENW